MHSRRRITGQANNWRFLPLAFLFLLLAACTQGDDSVDLASMRSGQSGLRVSSPLSSGEGGVESLPAALAGAKAAILLGVRKSDEAIPPPLDGDEVREGDVAGELAFLERSVTLLRINIQDLLNQSIDREKALQEYLSSLTSYAARAEVKFRSLERGEDELQDDERRLERNIRDLQNEMEDAIQAGEGKSTTALMEDILSQQRRLAEVSSELAVTELLVKAFEDIVEPLQERLAAVSANEDALLKGVQVVDMPGVEDLGVIKTEERIRSIRKRTGSRGTSNFGGPLY